MTLNEFKDWAVGQGQVAKATDGQFPGQCVSLINQYLYKVYGISAGAWGDAKMWANDGNPVRQYFDKVGSPQAGDIGVMGDNFGGGYGHIFIYLSPNTILEQNGRTPLRVTTGSAYANPIAILRHKGDEMVDKNTVIVTFEGMTGTEPTQEDLDFHVGKLTPEQSARSIQNSDRAKKFRASAGKTASTMPVDSTIVELTFEGMTGAVATKEDFDYHVGKLTTEESIRNIQVSDRAKKFRADAAKGAAGSVDPNNLVLTRDQWNAGFDKLKGGK